MNESENIKKIDQLLKPEVDLLLNANEKSFKKYGNIFHADEFLTADREPIELARHYDRLKLSQKVILRIKIKLTKMSTRKKEILVIIGVLLFVSFFVYLDRNNPSGDRNCYRDSYRIECD